ncbi:LruC domain-containing protein [Winogradskyella sp. PG-2]|uniref:LruC domain-containing protein n=1 Tax=Winogradskyella sp. PG-2 TaxID=754409 RepID=UPI0004588443|nr:LruC domain-containing protein [Winogradskyella sp. PG-2]BAO75982.1 hypothetical protein WPG_1752 [Winogradskyella sp. PG-2]
MPKFCDKVYIRRNENLNFTSSIENIYNQKVNYNFLSADLITNGTSPNDYLFCVNGSGELFEVDSLDGLLTYLSDMPMGSFTCAIDQENKVLYSIGKSSPYPLMKYSIEFNTWETIAELGIGEPRLDYNDEDGLLYFSKNDRLYTFNPNNGSNLDQWVINGLHNVSGGDLAFAEDGTLFLCTFSGLYRLELDENDEYQSTRISADNLPFQPTSMTFDSNQELWLANNSSSSDLIIMDTVTVGWQYRYGINANNNSDYGRTINDLTTFRVYSENPETIDTDNDGIPDQDDSYPEDPDKAFEVFTPSKYVTGTIAFEDLWPSDGDYDFNDMALNYQAIAVLNSENLAVQIDFIARVKSDDAGYTNGVGIEMEGISPSQIQSVIDPIYTENFINLNTNGTEVNQDNAVIILTDNAGNLTNETFISVKFVKPITTTELGVAPFNPFIIVNKEREKEIHLPYYNTTSLGNRFFDVEGVNNDHSGNYISNSGFPWGISIIHDFKVPKPSVAINEAYNFFNNWAESGGTDLKDWYKGNPGNRNPSLLKD